MGHYELQTQQRLHSRTRAATAQGDVQPLFLWPLTCHVTLGRWKPLLL